MVFFRRSAWVVMLLSGVRYGAVSGDGGLVVIVVLLIIVVNKISFCTFRRTGRGGRVDRLFTIRGLRVRGRCAAFTARCSRLRVRVGGSSLHRGLRDRGLGARQLLRRLQRMGADGTTRVVHLGGRLGAMHTMLHACIVRVSSLGGLGRTLTRRGRRMGRGCARTAHRVGGLSRRGGGLGRGIALTTRLSTAKVDMRPEGGHNGATGGMGSIGGVTVSFAVIGGVATGANRHALCVHVTGPSGSVLAGGTSGAFPCRGHGLICSVGGCVRCAKRRRGMAMC